MQVEVCDYCRRLILPKEDYKIVYVSTKKLYYDYTICSRCWDKHFKEHFNLMEKFYEDTSSVSYDE